MAPVEDPRRTQSELDIHNHDRALRRNTNRHDDSTAVGEFYTAIGNDGMRLLYQIESYNEE